MSSFFMKPVSPWFGFCQQTFASIWFSEVALPQEMFLRSFDRYFSTALFLELFCLRIDHLRKVNKKR